MSAYDRLPCVLCKSCKYYIRVTDNMRPHSCGCDISSDLYRGMVSECTVYKPKEAAGKSGASSQQDDDSYYCCDYGDAEVYELRGIAHRLNSNHTQALEDITKAIEILEADEDDVVEDSQKASPYYSRGLVYQAMGKPDKALADFKLAVKYEPDNEMYQNAVKKANSPVSEKSAATKPEPPAEKPAAEKSASKAKFCSECGAELKSGAKFCSECGAKT